MQTEEQPSRPSVLSLVPDGIPAELKARPQWVVWRLVRRDSRWTKVVHTEYSIRGG